MVEHDLIASSLQRLDLYRRTFEFLSAQQGQAGGLILDDLQRQVADTRREISLLKRELRSLGVIVEDHPTDADGVSAAALSVAPADQAKALLEQYHRTLVERLGDLVLDGMSRVGSLRRPLVELYIERTLTPVEQVTSGPAAPTLADLLCVPGSRVILADEVGSGRSTCMQRIALACAARAIGELGPVSDPTVGWASLPSVTILLNAYDIDASLDQPSAERDDSAESGLPRLWRAIDAWLRERQLDALVPIILLELERGACLLLLDGLDEILEDHAIQRVATALGEFGECYPHNRLVVTTSRSDSTLRWLRGWNSYRLAPLDRSQFDAMIEGWLQSLSDHSASRPRHDVTDQVAVLQGLLHGDDLIEELAASPLLLALWILTFAEGHPLPAAQGLILWQECDLLLNGWGHSRRLGQVLGLEFALATDPGSSLLQPLAAKQHLSLLQSIALKLQDSSRASPTLTLAEVEALLREPLAALGIGQNQAVESVIPRLLLWCCRRSLLAEVTRGHYAMPRQMLREYLAARALASWPDFPQRAARAADSGWRKMLPLFAYELARGSQLDTAYELVRSLIPSAGLASNLERQSLLVAAECLATLDCAEVPIDSFRAEAQQRLVVLIGTGDADLHERIQAGTLLGRLGDPRVSDPLPPLASVAAGPFIFGMLGGFDDEGPARRVDVPAFAIGIYPVTNQEYTAFVNDTGHAPPRYEHDSRFNNPSYPVVGVTWHDAIAYCTWLQGRLAAAGLLAPDMVVRLPLELEWEKAASWDPRTQTKRRYPWGETWSNTRANTAADRGPWMITPVGCYPEGLSPYGLHDCIGNVWEWMASQYRSYPGAAVRFHEPASYVLRGSSCISLPKQARCTYRSRLPADYWRYHLGFRIVIARPPNELELL